MRVKVRVRFRFRVRVRVRVRVRTQGDRNVFDAVSQEKRPPIHR